MVEEELPKKKKRKKKMSFDTLKRAFDKLTILSKGLQQLESSKVVKNVDNTPARQEIVEGISILKSQRKKLKNDFLNSKKNQYLDAVNALVQDLKSEEIKKALFTATYMENNPFIPLNVELKTLLKKETEGKK